MRVTLPGKLCNYVVLMQPANHTHHIGDHFQCHQTIRQLDIVFLKNFQATLLVLELCKLFTSRVLNEKTTKAELFKAGLR